MGIARCGDAGCVIYNNQVQRNMELVRAILLKIEAAPTEQLLDVHITGHTDEEISYHVMLLHKAGLVEAVDCSHMQANCWKPLRLTWDGHEFIDAVRSDTFWKKTKSFVVEKTGTLTLEAVKAAIPIVLKTLLLS